MSYGALLTMHLLAPSGAFVGTVFSEVVTLKGVRKVPPETMHKVEGGFDGRHTHASFAREMALAARKNGLCFSLASLG